jgi:toxin CptA
MSIAMSVLVKPSRLLLVLTAGMGLAVVLSAGRMVYAEFGHYSSLQRLLIAGITLLIMLLIAIWGFFQAFWQRKTFRIDISAIGQIRLAEYSDVAVSPDKEKFPERESDSEMVQLMGDSTIWPNLLLLRFCTERGQVIVLPILPDSISSNSFRALSVACHWIAAHNNRANDKLV